MRINSLLGTAAGALLLASLHATAANAQATRTWVSGVGDDVNPCSRTAPCKTFAGAISKTAQNGEINCLDPAGYGAVTITKSMTLNCFYTHGSILNSGTTGIIINITNAADPLKSVRIVGIQINGPGSGTRAGIHGVNILAANAVFIEDSTIDNNTQVGIRDVRTTAGSIFVKNTMVRNNGGAGLQLIATAPVTAVLDNVRSLGNANGIGVGPQTKAMISNSNFSGNSSSGVQSDSGGNTTLDGSTVSHNGTGITVVAGGTMRISNNNISLNATGISGTTLSHQNNRISGNSIGAGTTPTVAGVDTNPKSQN